MAFWDKITSRGNVEDRRSMGPSAMALGGGSLGLGGLALILLLNYLGGGNIGDVLSQLQDVQVPTEQASTQGLQSPNDYNVFASTVLGSTNDMWGKIFSQNNRTYNQPKLVLFRGATPSGCGMATSQVGPHYCPSDETIYLDETFFDELQTRFGGNSGDVAQAYVIAHEVGHNAQKQLGIMDKVDSEAQDSSNANELSIKLELQADCFAGLWANSIKDQGVFEPNEISEALSAASAVGDDRIQEAVEGRISPENWTHGSSEQRVEWFNKGFDTGSISTCNTF